MYYCVHTPVVDLAVECIIDHRNTLMTQTSDVLLCAHSYRRPSRIVYDNHRNTLMTQTIDVLMCAHSSHRPSRRVYDRPQEYFYDTDY